MTNPFYNAPAVPVDFTVARAGPLRAQFAAIEAAFDKLDERQSVQPAGGTANALTVALTYAPDEYAEGMLLFVEVATTNTGPATLNVNGLGPVPIVSRTGLPLVAGDLVAGSVETLFYVDGVFSIRAAGGAQGPQGIQGPANGPAGLSAYQVALANGFVGTQAQWLASLVGPAVPGANGKTVLNGAADPGAGIGTNGDFYINTATWHIFGPKALGAWPAGVDMVGDDGLPGAPGLSAYQVAVANGYVGSQAAWLASLEGADGTGSSWNDLANRPAKLVSLGGLVAVADRIPYFTGADTMGLATLSPFMRGLLSSANVAALSDAADTIAVSEFDPAATGFLRINVAGVIFSLMWGTGVAAANGYSTITYPDGGFSSFSVPVASAVGDIGSDAQQNPAGVTSSSAASFQVYSASNVARPLFWIAVGV